MVDLQGDQKQIWYGQRRVAHAQCAPERVLAVAAVGAFAVMVVAATADGPLAMWSLISVGLFH